ncbi:glycosyltransferase involved in cell wall biosynthesis [Flavobacterium sp. PL11]|jgi:glycosyltransferase involved in cell wall biosynthesis|uniref:glycosyltransferase n=1 Tax=Flavobacterium sp. PL11 TaxID=3071717 RepID=UPI002DFEE55A|nr:glycosyltransferase involved in cell wall biosynthesis [Flavobacterium sp. PL11]
MRFAIITHVPHLLIDNQFFAYAPYSAEMNIWGKFASELIIVAPVKTSKDTALDDSYHHANIKFVAVDSFDVMSLSGVIKALLKAPKIIWYIYKAMWAADHIHLRCPGNMGLLGCLVQIAFPFKSKTAKYAGNWDPKSKQPWSYNIQKYILSNTFLTHNMQVLVYGNWKGNSTNIKSFFNASYKENEKNLVDRKDSTKEIKFVFVGGLVAGKNPLYAIQLVECLSLKGYTISLTILGDGKESENINQYCIANNLEKTIIINGNQNKETVKTAYQDSHFVILPSKSEGWPKAIAEGMFWGCVPIATKQSCIPDMLDHGNRGILLEMDLKKDVSQIETIIKDQILYHSVQARALKWSREYTTDFFEAEIKKLLQ